ncbi:3-isopropylmalate dehydratase large subunit (plasmid) [Skermanella mucosa]|uniref:3-isopropylmalate dehydratase large subunit n=1 Tax=Skermanella mucosa TaxID=1789672 RepID=UPI00192C7919|nr:3-isopropylmalate dehydratase large subunit [Skermanella mucosa]UEM24422.1 3-isopropylmalate dehydratase large subunit [Skermanella mucosa]
MSRTLFDKVWDSHAITRRQDGMTLLFVDRHYVHDGTRQAFQQIEKERLSVRRPDLTFGTPDHYVATKPAAKPDPLFEDMVAALETNTRKWEIMNFGVGSPNQGIVHVVAPELGLTLPGALIVCGDSHTATHGAVGALAFGIGASEIAHVLATQTLWQKKPKRMRISVTGTLPPGVVAKDLVLAIIGRIGAAGGTGHAIEYGGPAIRDLSMEARMTLCNMSIEAGARCGMVAPDETTFDYVRERPYAPTGENLELALAAWRDLVSDPDAVFDSEVVFDAGEVAPTVTWGTSPETALPITEHVPDPAFIENAEKRRGVEEALQYMALTPGMALSEIVIDRVFIGSCTNGRIEDIRAAAEAARGRRAVVPAAVIPGSARVKAAAEAEGLDVILREAGFEWREPGCSMCVGMNGDIVQPGERCASTSNRNFAGRQGRGSRTHLLSPAMAVAAAVTGRLTDIRTLKS